MEVQNLSWKRAILRGEWVAHCIGTLCAELCKAADSCDPIEMLFRLYSDTPKGIMHYMGFQLPPVGRGNFEGEGRPTVKYRDALP